MANDSSGSLVTVAHYNTSSGAQLAKTQLENAGIPCMIANGSQSGLAMPFNSSSSGVQVKVPEDRSDEARDVLDLGADS